MVIAVYIPTQSKELIDNTLLAKYKSTVRIMEEFKQSYPKDNLLIIEDFNRSRIKWKNGELLGIQIVEPVREIICCAEMCVKVSFASFDLKQF